MMTQDTSALRFNQILRETMSAAFELTPLPLDPELRIRYADSRDKSVSIKGEYLGCSKTAGVRMGEMDFGGSMLVHFGSVPPADQYIFPILGFTFVHASKFLICVLDLHPLFSHEEYRSTYIEPLKKVYQKYARIPKAEGGRSEVHDWAKQYESGYAFYRWCEPQYLPDVENAFKDYVRVFCEGVTKALPQQDAEILGKRAKYLERYRYDYSYKDPGSSPLKTYFGEEWGDRFMNNFLFAP